MIDDDFVAAIGTERGLHCLGYGSTCFYISYYGAIFRFVAGREQLVGNSIDSLVRKGEKDVLLVSLLKETTVRRAGHRQRHIGRLLE